MCSLHTRIAKKCNAEFDELRGQINQEATDDTVYRIKAAKQKAKDECLLLHGCPSVERYLKVLGAPTPTARQLMLLQNHVDELLKVLR